MDLCEDGRKVFGVPEPKRNQIVRVTMNVESVEIGGYEVKAEFKPFEKAKRKPRKKAK